MEENINPAEEVCVYPHLPQDVVEEITAKECENLQAYTGLDGQQIGNTADLAQMICDIKQEVDTININEPITIYANDASKCADDNLPTLASFFSRILRYAQAATCVLCAYDPRVAEVLRQGHYPQILMGSANPGGYPQWATPDEEPTEGSILPVQSAGIYKAMKEALLAVWHLWEEQPVFDYFAQTYDDSDDLHNLVEQTNGAEVEEGATALVASGDGKTSLLYTYTGGEWTFTRELTLDEDNLRDFAVTHINYGFYKENGVYYFDGTWQLLDADFGEIEQRISQLERVYETAVTVPAGATPIMLATAATMADAEAMLCDPDREMLILITG